MVSVICIIAELLRPSFDFPLLLCYPFGKEGDGSMHILLCDDDEAILTQLEGYLQEYFAENHLPEPELCRYTDGQRLLDSEDRPDTQRIDIAFLDVEMPGISGIEIGAKLKKQNPYLKVFIVTSYADYLDDAMRFHVFRYLSKPVDKQRLFRNLRDALYQLSVDTKPVCIETVDGTNRRRSTEKGRTGECLSVHIINKSSKGFGACALRLRTAQHCGKSHLECCPMRFPQQLQNRVPRGERAPVALWCAVLSCRFSRCWACATGTQHPSRQARIESFEAPNSLLFSYLLGSIRTVSVTGALAFLFFIHQKIINFGAGFSQVEPVCDSIQSLGAFFHIVHLSDLTGTVSQQVCNLPGRKRGNVNQNSQKIFRKRKGRAPVS